MEENVRKQLVESLTGWYASHWRSLPWRQNPTSYQVWISEIMLQQTRIEAVIPYYRRFLAACPDEAALAAIPEEGLLKLWEGLGYYSRARNLQKAARVVVEQYGGRLPADYDALLSLPGIGEYTAGAIASIAFSIPVPAVDGNVMRVLARLFGDATDVLSTAGKRRFNDLAWELVPEQDPGRFNQALMELGETVCLPGGHPLCHQCPLASVCVAKENGLQDTLPVRSKAKPRRVEKRQVVLAITAERQPCVLLHKRDSKGLLAGLWELPNALEDAPPLPEAIMQHCTLQKALLTAKHIFSHIEWHMSASLYELAADTPLPAGYALATLQELQTAYPLPGAFRAYTALLPSLLKGEDPEWTKETTI